MDRIEEELRRLANIVRRHKGVEDFDGFRADSRLREDLRFDSMDLAELTVRIEERFGVDVFAEGVVHEWGAMGDRVRRHVAGRS